MSGIESALSHRPAQQELVAVDSAPSVLSPAKLPDSNPTQSSLTVSEPSSSFCCLDPLIRLIKQIWKFFCSCFRQKQDTPSSSDVQLIQVVAPLPSQSPTEQSPTPPLALAAEPPQMASSSSASLSSNAAAAVSVNEMPTTMPAKAAPSAPNQPSPAVSPQPVQQPIPKTDVPASVVSVQQVEPPKPTPDLLQPPSSAPPPTASSPAKEPAQDRAAPFSGSSSSSAMAAVTAASPSANTPAKTAVPQQHPAMFALPPHATPPAILPDEPPQPTPTPVLHQTPALESHEEPQAPALVVPSDLGAIAGKARAGLFPSNLLPNDFDQKFKAFIALLKQANTFPCKILSRIQYTYPACADYPQEELRTIDGVYVITRSSELDQSLSVSLLKFHLHQALVRCSESQNNLAKQTTWIFCAISADDPAKFLTEITIGTYAQKAEQGKWKNTPISTSKQVSLNNFLNEYTNMINPLCQQHLPFLEDSPNPKRILLNKSTKL